MGNADKGQSDKVVDFLDRLDPFAIADRFLAKQAKNARTPLGEIAWMGINLLVKVVWIVCIVHFMYRIFEGWGK